MLGFRKRTDHDHDDASHWAGPGLVRMVCTGCGRVSIKLDGQPPPQEPEHTVAVDSLGWLVGESA